MYCSWLIGLRGGTVVKKWLLADIGNSLISDVIVKTYSVLRTTLYKRISNITFKVEIQLKNWLLNKLEEKVLLQYILNLDK